MALYLLDEHLWFPDVTEALEDGLLAIGGDLSTERLLLAYRKGIFPWFNEDELPMWWCPDPRFVLLPEEMKVSKSMQQLLKRNAFEFRINHSFETVIENCRRTKRKGQDGTWITEEVMKAYCRLHQQGYAYSAEAWKDGQLAGGLYGLKIGKVFFGESMFSKESNASKYAFISYVRYLQEEGIRLIDCQVYTEHLESMGAKLISRDEFLDALQTLITVA